MPALMEITIQCKLEMRLFAKSTVRRPVENTEHYE